MDSETRSALSGMADEVLDVAERLVGVGENLNKLAADEDGEYGAGDAACRRLDGGKWQFPARKIPTREKFQSGELLS